MLTIKPDTIDYILGLTQEDISTTKRNANGRIKEPEYKYRDWGIFGLAFKPGRSCIISTYRIKDKNDIKYIDRLKKICIHEFGHNQGLPHCPVEGCVMQDAVETIKTIDSESPNLCNYCRTRVSLKRTLGKN